MRKLVFALACVFFAVSARAEIIIVDDDGVADFNNIQAAIDDCNDGDTVMVIPGTYTGPGNGDINFCGKAITVRSVAPENPHIVAATVIDCNDGFHDVGFRFHSYEGPNSVVDGLTITGGVGSGIRCSSSPTIRNCAVRDWRGGGIRLWRSNATISNCTIIGNSNWNWVTKDWYGGGIRLWRSNAAISNCTFEGNLAGVGGALYCGGESTGSDATIINCTFTNNFAGCGGAVYCGGESTGSDAAIIKCTFTNNSADYGGAVYCGGESTGGNATITNCTFTNNSAEYGGGMYSEFSSNPILTGCTFAGNTAGYGGGGIFCDGDDYMASTPTITNCTFADNSAYYGGAVFCSGPWMSPIPNGAFIENCTFSGNSAVSRGGGIYCRSYSRALITNCTFTGNTAHRCDTGFSRRGGGAVYGCRGEIRHCTITYNRTGANGGGLYRCRRVVNCVIRGNSAGQNGGGTCACSEIANCVVTGNSATSRGGGIFMGYHYDYETITNCTITANWAGSEEGGGGGVFSYYRGFPVTNCILWANADPSGTGESAQIGGDVCFVTVTFGCIQDDDPNDSNVPFGGAENNNIDDNPMFVRDPNDGGDGWGDDPCTPEVNEAANDDFGDLHLAVSSPCINTGRPGLTAGWNRMDIDGQPRVIGGRVDMGADEYALIILVAKPEGGEVWVSGSKHEIKWESYGAVGTVDILLSTNSGSDWTTIEDNVANSGSYFLHLPQEVDSNRCVISVVPGKPDPDVICIESGMFTIHPDTPGAPVALKWKSLGGDFERAGLSANYGPELGCIKWQFKTEGAVSASPTIGAGDRVHIACEDGKLYTLDANGVLLWSYEAGSSLISAPTVGPDGSVYVGSESGKLYVIDINGNVRWTHTAGSFIYSSPAVSPETNDVYVCSSNGTLYALAQDGSRLWSFQTGTAGVIGSAIFASPALGSDGTVYVGGFNDANLYALDPDDGSVRWVRSLDFTCPYYTRLSGGRAFASPVVAPDGTIYQTLLFDPNLYAIDPDTGNILWSLWFAEPPGPYDQIESDVDGWSEPVLGPDGTIYVSLNDPCLRAVSPGGTIKWVTRLGMDDGFMLTVGRDGLIYAAGYDGYLCVVDPNGNELSRFQSDGWLTPPVISADNTIIVSDANNRILAIGGEGCEEQLSVLHRPYDLNGSRDINFLDFALLAADWLACNDPLDPCQAASWDGSYFSGDIDRNLYVDYTDLAAVANRWLGEE